MNNCWKYSLQMFHIDDNLYIWAVIYSELCYCLEWLKNGEFWFMGVEDLPISCYLRIIVYASNAEAILTIIFSFVRWFSHFMVLGVSFHSTNTKHLLLTRHCDRFWRIYCEQCRQDAYPEMLYCIYSYSYRWHNDRTCILCSIPKYLILMNKLMLYNYY